MALGGSLGLGITLVATDLASGPIKSVAKAFQGLSTSLLGVAAGPVALGLGVVAAGLTGVVAAVNHAGGFEHSMTALGVTTSMTGAEIDEVRQKILALGTEGRVAPEEGAKAFDVLSHSVLDAKQAMAALVPTVDLMEASGGKLGAGQLVKVMEAFPGYMDDATGAADKLAQAMKGGLSAEELAEGLQRAGKNSKFLGRDLDTVLENLSGLKAAGMPIGRVSEELLTTAKRNEHWNQGVSKMRGSLHDMTTTAAKSAKIMGSDWEGLKTRLGNSFSTLVTKVGEVFLPVATKVLGGLEWVVSHVSAGIRVAADFTRQVWERNFGGMKDVALSAFKKIYLAFGSIGQLLSKGEITGELSDELWEVQNEDVFQMVNAFSVGFTTIKEGLKEMKPLWQDFKEGLVGWEPVAKQVFGAIGEVVKDVVMDVEILIGYLSGRQDIAINAMAARQGEDPEQMAESMGPFVSDAAKEELAKQVRRKGFVPLKERKANKPIANMLGTQALDIFEPKRTTVQDMLDEANLKLDMELPNPEFSTGTKPLLSKGDVDFLMSRGQPIQVNLLLDGRKIAEAMVRHSRDKAAGQGALAAPGGSGPASRGGR